MNAKKDGNGVSTLTCASSADGTSIVLIQANVSNNNGLMVDDNTTGSDHGTTDASRDENSAPVLMAVSSADGVTPVEVYGSSGKILINSH